MLQEAVDRVAPLADPADLYVSTGVDLVVGAREQLPDLPHANLIVEPAMRNTGPAVGLECALLEARFPGCTIASLGSDAHIGKPNLLRQLLTAAEAAVESLPDCLVTVGVKPTRIETGYGYIRKGDVRSRVNGHPFHTVAEFKEKPDQDHAAAYVQSGEYLWNSNMFVWKAETMLRRFEEFEPDMFTILKRIQEAVGSPEEAEVIRTEYPQLKRIAIDNAILERSADVLTLEADIEWSDIGSWGAITDVLPVDGDGNLLSGTVLALDARNNTVYGPNGKLIAMVGVDDLVVVDTPDALLICPREKSQRVKDIVDRLRSDTDLEKYS